MARIADKRQPAFKFFDVTALLYIAARFESLVDYHVRQCIQCRDVGARAHWQVVVGGDMR